MSQERAPVSIPLLNRGRNQGSGLEEAIQRKEMEEASLVRTTKRAAEVTASANHRDPNPTRVRPK